MRWNGGLLLGCQTFLNGSMVGSMLELKDITFSVGEESEVQNLLHQVSLYILPGSFTAIVGPSGCGKTTLLKVIAGISEPSQGKVCWQGRDLDEEDLEPSEIGYVPQFDIAYDLLNIQESMEAALRLRVGGLSVNQRHERINQILRKVGLDAIADRMVRVLSGGQKRRLALSLEMVSYPSLLLCDEATSGLDPKTEEEIVHLMHQLSREEDRIVLSVTHSLRHLRLYDSIVVLHQGHVAYHGTSHSLLHHFSVDSAEEVFPKLASRSPQEWHEAWIKRREACELKQKLLHYPSSKPSPTRSISEKQRSDDIEEKTHGPASMTDALRTPLKADKIMAGKVSQFTVLLGRRWRIFFRDRAQIWLHLALMFGFPCLVVIFALQGLPQVRNLSLDGDVNVIKQLMENIDFFRQATKVGTLVSGLVMFQVILLTLMGSNNSAREVASERLIFEKEKLAGLSPASYLASKVCFLSVFVAAQSIWMSVFVNLVCRFPGNLGVQIALLAMVNAAMTAVCLGISSIMDSAEKASLVSIYLVGFQLPLSGALLALPKGLGFLTKPFIAAYWSWSGVLQTMRDTRFYDVVRSVTQTDLSPIPLCVWVMGAHVLFGLFLAYIGFKQSQWK